VTESKESKKVYVSDAAADAIDAWATAFKRYMVTCERLTDSCISLAKDGRSFVEQLARPSPKLMYGCAAIMNGCADIGDWLGEIIDHVRPLVRGAADGLRDGLDDAGVPTVEQATGMLDAAMKKAPEG
jgi:hypothetical protein